MNNGSRLIVNHGCVETQTGSELGIHDDSNITPKFTTSLKIKHESFSQEKKVSLLSCLCLGRLSVTMWNYLHIYTSMRANGLREPHLRKQQSITSCNTSWSCNCQILPVATAGCRLKAEKHGPRNSRGWNCETIAVCPDVATSSAKDQLYQKSCKRHQSELKDLHCDVHTVKTWKPNTFSALGSSVPRRLVDIFSSLIHFPSCSNFANWTTALQRKQNSKDTQSQCMTAIEANSKADLWAVDVEFICIAQHLVWLLLLDALKQTAVRSCPVRLLWGHQP